MTFSVLEDGVSEQLKLAEQRRLLSRVAMTISFILGSYFLITLIVMPVMTVGKFIAVFAALLIGSLSWLCHHEKLYTASAATIVGITIVGGFIASLSNGGADGFVAPIMISAPVTAAVFIGARATFISAVAVLLAFVSLLFLEGTGIVTEAPYSTQTLNIAAIMMLSVATGICASGVGYFAHAMQKQIRSLMASQDRLVEATQQLDHAAHHDLLTGVANRKGLNRFLDTLLAEETEHGHSLFLAHIDLDHFKTINDTHGHPVGDAVLQNAAEVMRRASLPGSMVARVGGDEFVIVSEIKAGIEFDTVQDHCNTLIQMLKTPMLAGGVRCQIGASIGFVFASRKGASVESIMTEADLALYKAKRDGRGHARAFLPHMRRQLETDHTFRLEIEDALRANQVECVLQPQACLATGRLIGMEALGRIRAQSGELLTPDRILPVLTEMGRLADFDFKVMLRGLDALVTLRRAGADLPSVSINASAVSLRSPDYVSRIVEALEQRGLSVRDVVVEILESTLIESSDDAAATSIRRLRQAGIRTIMDDFGVGQATLANMLRLDLDGLKIDRSLAANLEDDRTKHVLCAVQSMASDMGLSLIVEGVETAQQFALLRQIGCGAIQGFGLCRPLELGAFAQWVRDYGRSPVEHLQVQLRSQV